VLGIEESECQNCCCQKDGVEPGMKELKFQFSSQGICDDCPAPITHEPFNWAALKSLTKPAARKALQEERHQRENVPVFERELLSYKQDG
jgi:hypothetical protein